MIARDLIIVPATQQVGNVYPALDCFLIASPSKGFCLSLVEAWYCGVPTVSTPVGVVLNPKPVHGPSPVRVPLRADGPAIAAAVRQAIGDGNREVVQRRTARVSASISSPSTWSPPGGGTWQRSAAGRVW